MTPEALNPELQTLLDHKAWVQALARRLVRDPGVADDVAQEAMLAALREPDTERRSIRAWLGTVVRNLVWERMRGEDRRTTRERGVARREAIPSTGELVERVAVHREVVEVLMALPEHYRDVLLRRYYEGETPTEIAERHGVPVSTVKTRLARGLAQMRDRLDTEHGGDGHTWLSALAPLALAPQAGVGLPALAKAGLAALVVATAATTLVLLLRPEARSRDLFSAVAPGAGDLARSAQQHELAGATPAGSGRLVDRVPSREPEDLSFAERAAAARASLDFRSGRVPGRVLGVDGAPRGGLVVRFESYAQDAADARRGEGIAIALAGPDGRFAFERVRGTGRVVAVSAELVTVHAGLVDGARSADGVTVLVAARATLAGRVTDGDGRGLIDARVEVRLPGGLRARFGRELERSTALGFVCTTDSGGRFALDDAPVVGGAVVRVSREGFEPFDVPAEEARGELRVVLQREAVPAGALTGQVVGSDGAPVPDARVSFGGRVTRADSKGVFQADAQGVTRLIAVAPGRAPALLAAGRDPATGAALWPEPLVLRLGERPLSIRGRVVAPEGRGLAGIRVFVADPTVFQPGEKLVEGQVQTFGGRPDDPTVRELPEILENMLGGRGRLQWRPVVTGADGAFELGGLADREYTLAALDPYTLVRVEGPRVAAGTAGVEVTLDARGLLPRVTGRVVDHAGRPVSGVLVQLGRSVLEVEYDDKIVSNEGTARGGVRTRGDGTFELDDVPRAGVWLRLEAESIVPRFYGLAAEEKLGPELRIVVQARLHLRVAPELPDEADRIAVLDVDGAELSLLLVQGGRRVHVLRAPLVEGRTEVLTVSDDAAELVLYRGEREVRRAPVVLLPGMINEIRP